MNWLDWLFVIIMGLSILRGLKVGFFAGVAGIAGLLGGVWAAINYHRHLADFLSSKWNWDQRISEFLLSNLSQNHQDNLKIGRDQGEGVLDTLISPGDVLNIGLQTIQPMADSILNAISFVLIVIVTYIIAGGILRIISRTVAGTVLSPFDKLGGLLLGLVKGGISTAIVLMLLLNLKAPFSFLSNHGDGGFLTLAIEKSIFSPLLLSLINSLNLPLPAFDANMAACLRLTESTILMLG